MNPFPRASDFVTKRKRVDLPMIGAQRQTVWGWPAVINFALGGAGGGLYLVSICLPVEPTNHWGLLSVFFIRILAAGLVASGLLSLAAEAGRPFRARFLLGNLRRSWMARETLAAILFLPVAVVTAQLQHPILIAVGAAAALAFILSQGFILYRACAIPAWNVPSIPVLFLTSALAGGAGVLLALPANIGLAAPNLVVLTFIIVCSLADVIVWGIYLGQKDPLFQSATEALRASPAIFCTVIGCRLIPILLILSALAAAEYRSVADSLLTIAGCGLFAGSMVQKTGIIRTCGYLRPIGLSFQPRRRA